MTETLPDLRDPRVVAGALQRATEEYVARHPRSRAMFERARRSLPGETPAPESISRRFPSMPRAVKVPASTTSTATGCSTSSTTPPP